MKQQKSKKPVKQVRNHKKHHKEFAKVYWPYIPVIGLVLFGLVSGIGARPNRVTAHRASVLAYSTEMSINGLLSGTNSERVSRGLGSLALNSKLSQSAQAKAQDMATRDYWAHNTPDGQEPWVFFQNAGYAYKKAGENLAYGFATSSDTIVGWMNSPGHRANILDAGYTEVGFGFINVPNFVGNGENTVVVAHYASPQQVAVAPPSPTPNPSTKPASTTAPNPSPSPQPAESPAPVEATPEEEKQPEEATQKPAEPTQVTSTQPVPTTNDSTRITRLQQLTNGYAPWSALALSIISIAIVSLWIFKHATIVKRALVNGEQYVLHHPIIDIAVAAVIILAIVLSQSSGIIL